MLSTQVHQHLVKTPEQLNMAETVKKISALTV